MGPAFCVFNGHLVQKLYVNLVILNKVRLP